MPRASSRLLGLVTCCFALLADAVVWDILRTTYGPSMTGVYFQSQPRTRSDALDQGWTKLSGCEQGSKWRGERYIRNDDHTIVLIYDVSGNIAGIQTGFETNDPRGLNVTAMAKYTQEDGGYTYVTTYFADPKQLCDASRNACSEVENIYFQRGSCDNLMTISTDLSAVSSWTLGKCFPKMGVHYAYGYTTTSSCDDLFPLFLLYDQGVMKGIGFALIANFTSPHYEHPTLDNLKWMLYEAPQCVSTRVVSSIHIFLSQSLLETTCKTSG
ncbi:uncharacterized protein LOC106050172 isoform X4 [Biomphalaria glabrata]|uniref:Uncharacterized protein LOC106050172 isoform X4 n=1 Tax=Biomphalaria glabrata TaxID=6526 RepID=A0A9W2Z532_BIOGL|nr:uncharacterized protein LOC106050172 isoform X4 [Biomphalaria glabrata]